MVISSTAKRLTILILAFNLVVFALYYRFGYQRATLDVHYWLPSSSFPFFAKTRPRKLYHLLPINSGIGGARFCKALLSAVVHGYDPLILNWEMHGEVGDMQRQKVIGMVYPWTPPWLSGSGWVFKYLITSFQEFTILL